jgi:hypothetical protein
MRGLRWYHALVEGTYVGGTLPTEAYDALVAGLRGGTKDEASCTVPSAPHDVLVAELTVRARTPLEALAGLDTALDPSPMLSGLFDRFDVMGNTLRAGPAQRRGAAPAAQEDTSAAADH